MANSYDQEVQASVDRDVAAGLQMSNQISAEFQVQCVAKCNLEFLSAKSRKEYEERRLNLLRASQLQQWCKDADGNQYFIIGATEMYYTVLSQAIYKGWEDKRDKFLKDATVSGAFAAVNTDEERRMNEMKINRDIDELYRAWRVEKTEHCGENRLLQDLSPVIVPHVDETMQVLPHGTQPWNPVIFKHSHRVLPACVTGKVTNTVHKCEVEPGKPMMVLHNAEDKTVAYAMMANSPSLSKVQKQEFEYLKRAPTGISYDIAISYQMHMDGPVQDATLQHVPKGNTRRGDKKEIFCYPDKPAANVAAFAALKADGGSTKARGGKVDERVKHLALRTQMMQIKSSDGIDDAPTQRLLVQIMQISSSDTVELQVWQKREDTKDLVTMSHFPMKYLKPVFVHDAKGATECHAPDCIQTCFDKQIVDEAFPYPMPNDIYKTSKLPDEVANRTGANKKGWFLGRVHSVDKVQCHVTMKFKYKNTEKEADEGDDVLVATAVVPVDSFWVEYSNIGDTKDRKEHFDVIGMTSVPKVKVAPKINVFAEGDFVQMHPWRANRDKECDVVPNKDPWQYFGLYGKVVEADSEAKKCKVEYVCRYKNNPEGTDFRYEGERFVTFSFAHLTSCAKHLSDDEKEKLLEGDEWRDQKENFQKGPSKAKGKGKGKRAAPDDGEDGTDGKHRKNDKKEKKAKKAKKNWKRSPLVDDEENAEEKIDGADDSEDADMQDQADQADQAMDEDMNLPSMIHYHKAQKEALFNNKELKFIDSAKTPPSQLSTFQVLGHGGPKNSSLVTNDNALFHIVDDRSDGGEEHLVRIRQADMTEVLDYDKRLPAMDVLLLWPNPSCQNQDKQDGLHLQVNKQFHQEALKEKKMPWTVGCTFNNGEGLLRVIYRDAGGNLIAHRAGCYWSPTSIELVKVCPDDQAKWTVVAPPRITSADVATWKSEKKQAGVCFLEDYTKWLPAPISKQIMQALAVVGTEPTIVIDDVVEDDDDDEMKKKEKEYADVGIMGVELVRVNIENDNVETSVWVPCSAMNLCMLC